MMNKMMEQGSMLKWMSMEDVAYAARHRDGNTLIVDCRPFLSYNTCHIKTSINIYYNHIMSRRNCKISVYDFVQCSRKRDKLVKGQYSQVVFYDQVSYDNDSFSTDHSIHRIHQIFVTEGIGERFYMMKEGFERFMEQYPTLCKKQPPTLSCMQNSSVKSSSSSRYSMMKLLPATSLPTAEQEQDIREGKRPVEILPFLYLGCAEHSSSKSILEELKITAVLNVTKNCPNCFEDTLDYKNIPIDDSLSADIQKWFDEAVSFIDKVRNLQGKVLVHCYGGVSRSATICIAYLIHTFSYTVNQAYDYVKKKRPIISPNLNFMGQLMAYQSRHQLSDSSNSDESSSHESSPSYGSDGVPTVDMDCSSSTPVSGSGGFDFNSAAIICK